MRGILEQLFNGDLTMERSYNQNLEYKQALSAMVAIREKLLSTLNSEQKIVFQQFLDAQINVSHLDSIEDCVYGFKLGSIMIAEVFMVK